MHKFVKVFSMARADIKSCMSPIITFIVLGSFCIHSCYSSVSFNKTSNANPTILELPRAGLDIIDLYETQRNLKAFEFPEQSSKIEGGEFPDANQTFKIEDSKHATALEDKNVIKVSVIPYFVHPIPMICHELQTELAKSAANFTQCAIMNARPITICLDCVAPYNDTVYAYQQLMEASEDAIKCKDVFVSGDKLEIVQTMYGNILNLWNRGNCNSCYATKEGLPDFSVVSDKTLEFQQALSKVTECFETIRSLGVNGSSNNTCVECRSLYEHLGALYDSILKDMAASQLQTTEEVCADIADAMNITHHLWNNQFKCKLFGVSVGYAMIVLTASLSTVPILFYLAAKTLSNAETIHLVLPKRKQFVQDSTRLL